MAKKLLITGADGFVGRNVLEYAQKQADFEVYKATRVNCDLLDEKEIRRFISQLKPDVLIHCAWYVNPSDYLLSEENVRWRQAGYMLYDAFFESGGQRAVFLGTCFEYGDFDRALTEEISLCPTTKYAEEKARLGQVLLARSAKDKTSFVWARLFYLFGPHEKPERLVPYIINELLDAKTARCSHGNQLRDYLYVQDVASALLTLAKNDKSGAFNVGAGIPVRLNDIFKTLEELLGGEILCIPYENSKPEPLEITADNTKLLGLGWKPEHTLESGLMQAVDWWITQRSQTGRHYI